MNIGIFALHKTARANLASDCYVLWKGGKSQLTLRQMLNQKLRDDVMYDLTMGLGWGVYFWVRA